MSIQYVSKLSKFQTFSLKLQKQFILYCLKKVNSVPQRMSSTFATRRATGSPKSRRSKISKRNIGTHTKKNFTAWKENYFKLAWRLTINISYYSFCHWKLTLYGSVCSNTSLSLSIKKYDWEEQQNWNKSKKKRRLYWKILILFTLLWMQGWKQATPSILLI